MQLPPDGPIVAQCGPPKAILELELTTGEVGSKVDREAMLGNGDCSFFFSVSLSLSLTQSCIFGSIVLRPKQIDQHVPG